MWAATLGLRRYIVAMAAFIAAIGVFEALLFAMPGNIVDWLARVAPTHLWQDERSRLLSLGAVLLGSMGPVALQSMFKQQALAGNSRCAWAGTFIAWCWASAWAFTATSLLAGWAPK